MITIFFHVFIQIGEMRYNSRQKMTVHANGIEMFAWIDILKLVRTV